MVEFITHSLIRPQTIQARIYQQIIYASVIKKNSLVILPTGLGKTIIFIMVIARYLKSFPELKVIIIAPTRPLLDQHYESCKRFLVVDHESIQIISGSTSPQQRNEIWEKGRIFIATPQTLRNDIINKNCDLNFISLICFDEAHRAIGGDAYVLCAKQFYKINPKGRILGFTASPGKIEKISEITSNLFVQNIEYMDDEHEHVKPYIHTKSEKWIWVELGTEFKNLNKLLNEVIKSHLKILKEINVIDSIQISKNPKKKILTIPKVLNTVRNQISNDEFFNGMSSYGQLMLLYQGSEMLETQGIHTFLKYLQSKIDELKLSDKKSLRRFINDQKIQNVYSQALQLKQKGIIHPKLKHLIKLVTAELNENLGSRILIFSNYKATIQMIVDNLSKLDNVRIHRFVGQSSSKYGKGLPQKQQKAVLDDFKEGRYNILASTSVGEEGLDIAQCDLVIFYDVTPSATRLIQRSGRTGRARGGKVVILITKGTRDENYFYSANYQKKKIKESIQSIKKQIQSEYKISDSGLEIYFSDQNNQTASKKVLSSSNMADENTSVKFEHEIKIPVIYMDYREKGSKLLSKLLDYEIELNQTKLPYGDFIISSRVGIERKTIKDFLQTLARNNLFDQLIELKKNCEKPILLVEGKGLYQNSFNKASIRGAINSIIIDYSIPIIFSVDENETAEILVSLARREQINKSRKPVIHSNKPASNLSQEQIFLISALPNIDHVLAQRMLKLFSTPLDLFNSTQDNLRKVHGIGHKIANHIDTLLTSHFSDGSND